MNYEQVTKNILRKNYTSHTITETEEDGQLRIELIVDDKKYVSYAYNHDDLYYYLLCTLTANDYEKV